MFKKQQIIQRKKQMTAYEKQAVHDIFRSTIEWFEKYVEVVYKKEFPDWENRKQIRDNFVVTRKDIYENPKSAEEGLACQLQLLSSVLEEDVSVEFEKELKQDFYKWISAVGIDINNCPERLKHFIFGLNEIFEGNYEKIRNDIANRKRDVELDDPKYMDYMMKVFSHAQVSMHKEGKKEKSMEGKNPDEVKFNNFSGGDTEQGEQVFKGIAESIAGSHENFYFQEQKGQQQLASSSGDNPPDIKNNPQNWILDEIPTEIEVGSFNGSIVKKWEIVVYHRNARLNDFKEGKLDFNNNPIYKWNSFKVLQKFEIKNTLTENKIYLNKDYLTDDEISFVIKEFADKPGVWRIEPIQGRDYLVHSSAQIKENEIGTLMHEKDKFSNQEWAEIKEVLELNNQYNIVLKKLEGKISFEYGETRETLEIWAKDLEKKLLINNIRKNASEWEIRKEVVVLDFNEGEVLARKTVKIDREEDYDLTGKLINKPNELYRKDYFDEKEQAEINTILNNYKIIEKVIQNKDNWMFATIGGNNGYEVILNKETALMDGGTKLNVNGEYYRKEQFSDSDWKSMRGDSYQNQQQSVNNLMPSQGDNKDNGAGKIFGILGIVGVLAITGIVVVKKKLNKKVKKVYR